MEKPTVSVTETKLPSQLLSKEDIDRINDMFKASGSKDSDAIKNRHTKEAHRSIAKINHNPALLCPVVSKKFFNINRPDMKRGSSKQNISCLGYQPIISLNSPNAITMLSETITIGRSTSNNIVLTKYGSCNFISHTHATIYVNGRTGFYEIINHSSHGIWINNILFGKAALDTDKEKIKLNKGKEVLDLDKENINLLSNGVESQIPCKCFSSESIRVCHKKGPITIGHGFVLGFGCVSFVFSLYNNM